MNSYIRKIRLVSNFFKSLITYGLYTIYRNLSWAIIIFIFVPIVAFAIVYWFSGTIGFTNGNPLSNDINGFFYSMYFSIATFTGMELFYVVPRYDGLWISALEGIVAYVVTVIILAALVNTIRLSE